MPRKKNIDEKKFIKEVESGASSVEIMKKFGIKTSAQLKSYYLDILVNSGQVKGISGRGSGAKGGGASKDIVVNKRGSLVIPRAMVEEMGFNIDDAFSIRKTKSGVSLKKL